MKSFDPNLVAVETSTRSFIRTKPKASVMPNEQNATPDKPLILVVDDNLMSRKTLSLRLEKEGHRVETVNSGEQALASIASSKPDLVFLDLKMDGMGGLEVLKTLQADEATRTLPVVIVSGVEDPATIEEVLSAGAKDFVNKPVSAETLQEILADLLGRTETEANKGKAVSQIDDLPLLNTAALAQLQKDYGQEKTREFLARFEDLVPGQLETIGSAAAEGDRSSLNRAAGALKGTARTLGFTRLAAACREIEQASVNGQAEELSEMASALARQAKDALAALDRDALAPLRM